MCDDGSDWISRSVLSFGCVNNGGEAERIRRGLGAINAPNEGDLLLKDLLSYLVLGRDRLENERNG
jgi:hypothetical protein